MASQNVAPNKPVGNVVPAGNTLIDPISGIAATANHARYTAITTSGTTTVVGTSCVLYGAIVTVLATATDAITLFDGTTALAGTYTATAVSQAFGPTSPLGGNNGLNPFGIRCQTSLVVVTAGTAPNTYIVLWD
jgi:hypothetical protein